MAWPMFWCRLESPLREQVIPPGQLKWQRGARIFLDTQKHYGVLECEV